MLRLSEWRNDTLFLSRVTRRHHAVPRTLSPAARCLKSRAEVKAEQHTFVQCQDQTQTKNGTNVKTLVPDLLGLPAAKEEPQLLVTPACGCRCHTIELTDASPATCLTQDEDGRIIDHEWC
jgi:hypothetical protein